MKILHIASFNGNIGDIANHQGFYDQFGKYIDPHCCVTQIEVRDFYRLWGLRKFDDQFVEAANQHDLLVLGGGAFFEPKWDYSATGTTFDLSNEVLDKIKTPMLFNGVGFSVDKGVSNNAMDKFGCFLDNITSSPKCLVSVRNDGSHDLLRDYYGEDICNRILKSPDFGYFINPPAYPHTEIVEGKTNIAIVLGGDMPEIRFPDKPGYLAREEFTSIFSAICNKLLETDPNRRIIFIPHIPKDIGFIGEVMEKMSDRLLRQQVTCAPYLNGIITDGLSNIELYRHCDLVLGMRHHANVCALSMNIPGIAIVNYAPHEKDYQELGLQHRCFSVNRPGFENTLMQTIETALRNPELFKQENTAALAKIKDLCECYFSRVTGWLKDI